MIRFLEDKDIEACCNLYNWYIENTTITFEEETLTVSQFTDRVHRIQTKYPYIVLEEDSKIVGYAYLDAFSSRVAYNWTTDLSIYLDHTCKSKGYGSLLMKEILHLAQIDGYCNVVSIVTEGNIASEHIHEKFGFQKKTLFENFGYKFNKWLGVTYYVKQVNEVKDDIQQPQNRKQLSH